MAWMDFSFWILMLILFVVGGTIGLLCAIAWWESTHPQDPG
jgi:hypothetical protein